MVVLLVYIEKSQSESQYVMKLHKTQFYSKGSTCFAIKVQDGHSELLC